MSNEPTADREIVSAAWTAECLGKPLRTVLHQAKHGQIPHICKLPGRTGAYLFDRAAIEAIAEALARRTVAA